MTNNYIKLPNEIYDDFNISNEAITILTLLYRNYMQYKLLAICSIQILADLMRFNITNNKKTITVIKDALSELVTKKYITNLYDLYYIPIQINKTDDNLDYIKDKDMIFYAELVAPPNAETGNYFMVNDEDINKIFSAIKSSNLNKFNLIRYFLACRRVSNSDNNFGYLSQSKLKRLVNDSRTIQKYNKLLQDELHLIRYDNSYLTVDKHYFTTFIGHDDDETNFNNLLKIEVEAKGLVHTNKVISNKKRSVKQKINKLDSEKDIKIKELEEQLKQYEALQYKPKPTVEPSDNNIDDTWGGEPVPILTDTDDDAQDDSMNLNEIMPEIIIEDDSDDQMDIEDILELQTEDEYNREQSKSNIELFEEFIESKNETAFIFGEYDDLFLSMGFVLSQLEDIYTKDLSNLDYSKINFKTGISRMEKELKRVVNRKASGF